MSRYWTRFLCASQPCTVCGKDGRKWGFQFYHQVPHLLLMKGAQPGSGPHKMALQFRRMRSFACAAALIESAVSLRWLLGLLNACAFRVPRMGHYQWPKTAANNDFSTGHRRPAKAGLDEPLCLNRQQYEGTEGRSCDERQQDIRSPNWVCKGEGVMSPDIVAPSMETRFCRKIGLIWFRQGSSLSGFVFNPYNFVHLLSSRRSLYTVVNAQSPSVR